MDLVSSKGPLMEREKSPHASLFDEDGGPSREDRLAEDAKFARNLRWSLWGLLGLTCLGAGPVAGVFAGWAGAVTVGCSFRAKGLEPIARWGRWASVNVPESTAVEGQEQSPT
jgi:hypothetical protein